MGGVRYVHQFSDTTNLPTNTSFKWPGCQQASWFGNLGSTMKPQLDIPSGNSNWLAVKSSLNEGFICFNGKFMYKWWIFKPTMFDCWRVSTWITNMWLLNYPSFWEWTSVGTKGSRFLILYSSYMRYLAKNRRELKKIINQYHLMMMGAVLQPLIVRIKRYAPGTDRGPRIQTCTKWFDWMVQGERWNNA